MRVNLASKLSALVGVVFAVAPCVAAPVLDQSHIITQSVGGLITVSEFTPAQTFTVGTTGILSQIDVQIGRESGALDDLTLEIWGTSGGAPSGTAPLYTAVIPATSVPVASPSTTLPFTSVNLAAGNLSVAPGQVYAAALRGVPDFDAPNAFWNWGRPGYSRGNPYESAFGRAWEVASSEYDFGFRTWVTPPPGPPGPAYTLIETAGPLVPAPGSPIIVQPIDQTYYHGVNFEVVRPTRIESVGASLVGGSGQVFAALVRLADRNAAPNPTNFSGSDVLGTTLLNAPSGFTPTQVTGDLDRTLQPGFYGLWLGSGKFGATGTTNLFLQNESVGSWYTWSMMQPSGVRSYGNDTARLIVNASSDSGTVQMRPSVDAGAERIGSSFVITNDDSNLNVERIPSANRDERAILEFDIRDIPSHAKVQSVTLQVDVTGRSSNGFDWPRMLVHGYAGDGQITTADANRPLNLIGVSPNVTASDLLTISINPGYVQSLLGTGNFLGLLGIGDLNNLSFSFRPEETAGFGEAPLLTIALSVAGDYNGDVRVDQGDYQAWRNAYGSRTVLAADGSGNGVVDAADHVVWRKRLAGGSGAGVNSVESVPEPGACLLWVIGLAAAIVKIAIR